MSEQMEPMRLAKRIACWCENNPNNDIASHWQTMVDNVISGKQPYHWEDYSEKLDSMRMKYAVGKGKYMVSTTSYDVACKFLISIFR